MPADCLVIEGVDLEMDESNLASKDEIAGREGPLADYKIAKSAADPEGMGDQAAM